MANHRILVTVKFPPSFLVSLSKAYSFFKAQLNWSPFLFIGKASPNVTFLLPVPLAAPPYVYTWIVTSTPWCWYGCYFSPSPLPDWELLESSPAPDPWQSHHSPALALNPVQVSPVQFSSFWFELPSSVCKATMPNHHVGLNMNRYPFIIHIPLFPKLMRGGPHSIKMLP